MTEPLNPMGGTAVAAPPTTVEPPADVVEANADSRRNLVIVGGVVAVLILAVAAYFLLFSGGSSTPVPTATVPHGVVAPGAAAKTAGGATQGGKTNPVTLPKKAAHAAGRDPFAPLVVAPVGNSTGSGGSTASTGSTGTSSGSTSTGTTTTTTTTTGTTTPTKTKHGSGGSKGSTTQPVAARVPVGLELVRLTGTKSATFEVFYNRGTRSEIYTVNTPTRQQLSSNGPAVFGKHFGFYGTNDKTASVEYDNQAGDNFYTLALHKLQRLG